MATQSVGSTADQTNLGASVTLFVPITPSVAGSISAVGINSPESDGAAYAIQSALYSDSGGKPYALLANSGSLALSTGSHWYDVSLGTAYLDTSGTQYWMALNNNDPSGEGSSGFWFYYASGGSSYYASIGSLGTWPSTISSGILTAYANTPNMRITYSPSGGPNPIEVIAHKFQPIFQFPV